MPVSLTIEQDVRRMKKKTSTYPIKLLVVSNRVPQRYQTIYSLSKEDYDKLSAPRLNPSLQKVRDDLRKIQQEADQAVREIQPFNFDEFERAYIHLNPLFKPRKEKPLKVDPGNKDFDFTPFEEKFFILKEKPAAGDYISAVFLWYVKNLIKEDRIGSALNYQNTYSSLKKFGGDVRFIDITPSYLRQYEKWMLNRGRSKSTVGINLRPLRCIFNIAIDEFGLIPRKNYPFGRRKYLIPSSRNVKKALTLDMISSLYYHPIEDEELSSARYYWFFFYFANGMNPKDAALLKYKDIREEFIVFERAKTILTTRNDPKPISVYLSDDIKNILAILGNKDTSPDNYVFPVLKHGMTGLEQHYMIKTFTKFVNVGMKRLCQELKVPKVTTIYTRHTFSTVLKRAGASTEYIQEALGHADKKTTENYLGSFEKQVKKDFSAKLATFKREYIDNQQE